MCRLDCGLSHPHVLHHVVLVGDDVGVGRDWHPASVGSAPTHEGKCTLSTHHDDAPWRLYDEVHSNPQDYSLLMRNWLTVYVVSIGGPLEARILSYVTPYQGPSPIGSHLQSKSMISELSTSSHKC